MGCPHGFSSPAWCDVCSDIEARAAEALAKQFEAEDRAAEQALQAVSSEFAVSREDSDVYRPPKNFKTNCKTCKLWATRPPHDSVVLRIEVVMLADVPWMHSNAETAKVQVFFNRTRLGDKISHLPQIGENVVKHFFSFNGHHNPKIDWEQCMVAIEGPVRMDPNHSIFGIAKVRSERFADGSLAVRMNELTTGEDNG